MYGNVMRVLNTANGDTIFIQNVPYDTTGVYEVYRRISEFLYIDIDDFMLYKMKDSIYLPYNSCRKLQEIGLDGPNMYSELYMKKKYI